MCRSTEIVLHVRLACYSNILFSPTGSSTTTWAEEDWKKADEDEADQSESHVRDHHRHWDTSTYENSAQAPFSPASLTTVHSSGRQSLQLQTSCASGCVELCCLCQHLLHLAWLNLNDWANCPCQVRRTFSPSNLSPLHIHTMNSFVCIFLCNFCFPHLNQSSVWKLCSSVSFLNVICWERTHCLVLVRHFKRNGSTAVFHWN